MRRKFDFWQSTFASFLPQRNRRVGRRGDVTPKSRRLHGRFEVLEDRCMLSVTGDYDASGLVDTADYTAWKTAFGNTVSAGTGADGNGDGIVDAADYTVWRDNLGSSTPAVPFVNISIDGLSEAIEESPGAIVFRNSDFSKQSLAMNQPESGLPLYVPDYSAPSSIFDPNAATDFTSAIAAIDPSMIGTYQVRFTYDNLQLELWTTQNWAGLDAAGPGLFRIPSGVNLVPNTATLSFLIEGLENSESFSTDFIQIEAIPTGGGTTLQDRGDYTVVEMNAAVDGNRDTAIDFDNSHDRQLLFWLNNDQEGFHDTDTAVESEVVDIMQPDGNNNAIDGRRDLEDLAPIRFDVDSLLFNNSEDISTGAQTPGQLSARYSFEYLGADGESFRLFFSSNTNPDVIRHVNNTTVADVQANDSFFQVSPRPAFTGNQILESVSAGLNSHLFEISGSTYGAMFTNASTVVLVTEIFYPDGSMVENRQVIELDIRDIKQFYTRWDIDYGVNGGVPGTDLRPDLTFQHFVTPTTPTHSSQVAAEPFLSGDDTLVFVHGWNMLDLVNEDWKAAYAETMFKRLYWQGFRGEFVAFNWPTYADDEGPREWPIFGTGANLTYNPSDLQAYRSARALREVLETYRGEFPDLQPLHVVAHSMGNIVVGEAMRQWAFDPFTEDPLVTTYVAMEAAVSSGAYGNNDTDSAYPGRPIPDLYRFWSHGRDAFSDPSLGLIPYFQGTNFSWEKAVNLYNENDYALGLWDTNNLGKIDFLPDYITESPVWPYSYDFEEGDGENENNDIFTRDPEIGPDVQLTLTLPNGQPGRDAYEILAFFAQSASLALGTKAVSYFDENIDIESLGMLGGSDIRANHGYQFNHDAAETWEFYEILKAEIGFGATHGAGAGAIAAGDSVNRSSRKPVSHGLEMAVDAIESEWMPIHTSTFISSTSIGHRSHALAGQTSDHGSVDLAMLDWLKRRSWKEEVVPAMEQTVYDEEVPQGHAAVDEVFELLDASIAPTLA